VAGPVDNHLARPLAADAAGYGNLRLAAQREDPAAVREAAQEFEALLVQRMLKEMRAASGGDGIFDSQQLDSYYELFDKQIALDMSRSGGLGLADQLVGQLESAARHGAAAAERRVQAVSGPTTPADVTRLPERSSEVQAQGPDRGQDQEQARVQGQVQAQEPDQGQAQVQGQGQAQGPDRRQAQVQSQGQAQVLSQESAAAAANSASRYGGAFIADVAPPPAGVTPDRGEHG